MALDTRDRRASAVYVGLPWRAALPLPDADLDQGDRQQATGYYRGILAIPSGALDIPLLTFGPLTIITARGSTVTTVGAGGGPMTVHAAGGSTAEEG